MPKGIWGPKQSNCDHSRIWGKQSNSLLEFDHLGETIEFPIGIRSFGGNNRIPYWNSIIWGKQSNSLLEFDHFLFAFYLLFTIKKVYKNKYAFALHLWYVYAKS